MGCWNGTCFLTNLPIMSGERIVLIPIVQEIGDEISLHMMCYHNELCHYAGLPIRGEYDDYGGIENIDDTFAAKENLKLFQNSFKNKNIFIEEDSDTKTIETLEGLINNLIERGNLYYNGESYNKGKKIFSFVMMHEKAFDNIIKEIGLRTGYNAGKTYETYIKDSIQKAYEKTKNIKEILKKRKSDPDNIELIKQEMRILYPIDRTNIFDMFMYDNFFFYHDLKFNKKLEKSYLELKLFNTAISLMRKTLIPQCGSGSQCQEYYLHKILSEFVIDKSNERNKEYSENENDEDNLKETLFFYGE